MKKTLLILLCIALAASFASARKATNGKDPTNFNVQIEVNRNVSDHDMYPVAVASTQDTTFLAYYTFNAPPMTCADQGWTSVDMTAEPGNYFHVDDFNACSPGTFGRLYPLEGSKSLWCGTCPNPVDEILCGYAAIPGYGNNWDQAFCTKSCVFVDSFATIDYLVMWDAETGYDVTTIEYSLCDDPYRRWERFAGGMGVYDGVGGPVFASDIIPVAMDSLRLRFHFTSDGAWSDQDGLWDTDGAIIIDSLTVRDKNGIVIPTELFEDEPVGDNNATDWRSCPHPGFGDLTQLIHALPTTYQNDPVQEDPCVQDFSCLWNFVKGSTINYACNTPNPSPQQAAIPRVNSRNQYIHNEIWSPWIPFVGTGEIVNLEFDVYRDLDLNALVFYIWHISSRNTGGANCPSPWEDRNWVYYGGNKDWYRAVLQLGDLVETGATHIRIALGVIDMCPWWCGIHGSGGCHSHAPLLDNVAVYRIDQPGPQFDVSDIDMFHDNFSADGTITGTARADMAQNVLPRWSPNILPGDSACISLDDPYVGLGGDSFTGCGPAAYCYASVDGHSGGLTPAAVEAPDTRGTCGTRFPHVTNVSAAGRNWYVYRMDSCFTSYHTLIAGRYCIDFNDDLFTPGDTCWFFFGARNATGAWSYYSLPYGQSSSINQVATYPDEFTILPAVGDEPGNDILYVDGMNFRGAQPFFDTAFRNLNLIGKIDRYDIRGSSSLAANGPASRVVNVANQLIGVYRKILWNTGDLPYGTFGDGATYTKSDDATMLFNWIDAMPNIGGIYFSGDDIADGWKQLSGPGAIALRAYCNYTVVNRDHVAFGLGVNPQVRWSPTSLCFHATDSMIAYGGCPSIDDFDVLAASPPLSQIEMDYWRDYPPAGPPIGGAIVSQTTTNAAGYEVKVILSGFSYHSIRDIDENGIIDRYHHMWDILQCLGNTVDEPTAVHPEPRRNSLAQNYPNPFNPVTTITYTIKEQAHVSLKVYNVTGQLVRTLVDEVQRPDRVTPVEWRGINNAGQSVSSGVYFYKLVTRDFTQTKKMVLLK